MKKTVLILALIVFLANIKAISQETTAGIEVGFNVNTFFQNYSDPNDEEPYIHFIRPRAGIVINHPINKVISVQTGAFYSSKGTAYDMETWLNDPSLEVKGYNRIIVDYIEVPMNLTATFANFSVFGGGYYAFGLTSKQKWDYDVTFGGVTETFEGSEKLEFNKEIISGNDNEEMKRQDIGVNLGVGYTVNNMMLKLQLNQGLSNLQPSDPDNSSYNPDAEKYLNHVYNFSVVFLF